jgi:DNA-directed RNA polymerase specialized sigma24 family protein
MATLDARRMFHALRVPIYLCHKGGGDERMTAHETLLDRARLGDEGAFAELVEPHRRELHVHCYRMLGSFDDADDALQDTLLAAWRGLATFQARASVRTWLYRVATNTCLNLV